YTTQNDAPGRPAAMAQPEPEKRHARRGRVRSNPRARRDRCHLYFFFRDARKSAAVVGPLTNVSSCEAMYWRKLRKKSAPVGSPSFSQDAFNAAAFSGGVSAG